MMRRRPSRLLILNFLFSLTRFLIERLARERGYMSVSLSILINEILRKVNLIMPPKENMLFLFSLTRFVMLNPSIFA